MHSLKKRVLSFLLYVYFASGAFWAWTMLNNFLWDRKYRHNAVLQFKTIEELGEYLSRHADMWKADTPFQLWDVMSTPEYAQFCFTYRVVAKLAGLDCDEFARYAATSIMSGLTNGFMVPSVSWPMILTVTWIKDGKVDGHNCCVLIHIPENEPKYAYMDYGQPKGHARSVKDVVRNVINEYEPGAEVMVWALHSHDLEVTQVFKGL